MRILGIDPGLARVGYEVIDTTGGQQRMLDAESSVQTQGILMANGWWRSPGSAPADPSLATELATWRSSSTAQGNTISVVQARGVVMMTLVRFKVRWWSSRRCRSSWPWLDSATWRKTKCWP